MDPVDKAFRDFNDTVNMTNTELEAWKKSDNRDVYREKKSGGQEFGQPLKDVMKLNEKTKDEWRDVDDGFNEVTQAREVTAFVGRMSEAEQGEPMPGTNPPLSKRDASLLEWGFDPNPGKSDFVGDRQK